MGCGNRGDGIRRRGHRREGRRWRGGAGGNAGEGGARQGISFPAFPRAPQGRRAAADAPAPPRPPCAPQAPSVPSVFLPPAPSVLLPPSVWKTRAGGKKIGKIFRGGLAIPRGGLKVSATPPRDGGGQKGTGPGKPGRQGPRASLETGQRNAMCGAPGAMCAGRLRIL